jgi:large subunit ribosomal protein L29
MKASKLRDLSVDQLQAEAADLASQLFRLRFQKATGQLENVLKIRQIRRDLARVKTVLTEREHST